jgi:hypothetical protein
MRCGRWTAGTAGKGWLVVRRAARAELAAVLAELGFTVGGELTPRALPAADKADE